MLIHRPSPWTSSTGCGVAAELIIKLFSQNMETDHGQFCCDFSGSTTDISEHAEIVEIYRRK